MSTPHNSAAPGDIAESILLPGDPLRAKYIADHFLESPVQFNAVRNILGYTGTFEGKKVSVMATGMGIPSIGIYTYELIHFYGVKNLIRIGSCGAMQPDLKLGDIVMAQGACTDSNYASQYNLPGTYSAIADFDLLIKAKEAADRHGYRYAVGNVSCTDVFYREDNPDKAWAKKDHEVAFGQYVWTVEEKPGKTEKARLMFSPIPSNMILEAPILQQGGAT